MNQENKYKISDNIKLIRSTFLVSLPLVFVLIVYIGIDVVRMDPISATLIGLLPVYIGKKILANNNKKYQKLNIAKQQKAKDRLKNISNKKIKITSLKRLRDKISTEHTISNTVPIQLVKKPNHR